MVNAWKPVLAAIVIFAAGVVTGSLVLDVATPQPARAFPERLTPTATTTVLNIATAPAWRASSTG